MVLLTLFFHADIMCKDGSVIPGGEWPSVYWMTDTPSLGAATRDMSWFVGFCHALFPRVRTIFDFLYPRKMFLNDLIKLQLNEVFEALQWALVTNGWSICL